MSELVKELRRDEQRVITHAASMRRADIDPVVQENWFGLAERIDQAADRIEELESKADSAWQEGWNAALATEPKGNG